MAVRLCMRTSWPSAGFVNWPGLAGGSGDIVVETRRIELPTFALQRDALS